ncbi:MAG: acetyl-coenzyme A synthetase, partial [Actinobacteria bacterium]|nr:acetyl-coenzyme A synthetase [Actinomycetota bacterium]
MGFMSETISDLGHEARMFPPSREFAGAAHVSDSSLHDEGRRDYQAYWARHAKELLDWATPWHTVCEWKLPYAKWFLGGSL